MNRQYRRVAVECERLRERLADTERHVVQLRNTLAGVARETSDLTVAHPCTHCERCYVLVRDGQLFCPACGYGRSV